MADDISLPAEVRDALTENMVRAFSQGYRKGRLDGLMHADDDSGPDLAQRLAEFLAQRK